MVEVRINRDNAGRRLDRVLSAYLNLADSAFLHKMLRKKNIVLNGKKADGKTRVSEGDVVTLYLADETVKKFRSADDLLPAKTDAYRKAFKAFPSDASGAGSGGPEILYEDDALLLLNKPQGMLSQKDRSGQPSINEWAIGYLLETGSVTGKSLADYTPSVANRLDRNTSGLIAVTKTRRAALAFSALQKEKRLQKTYRAVVFGNTKEADAVYETVEQGKAFNRMRVKKASADEEDTALSDTERKTTPTLTYRRLAKLSDPALSLLAVSLSEGKKHQIRVQLANLGYPVVLDDKYGDRKKNRGLLAAPPSLMLQPEKLSSGMHLLHAFSLTFPKGLEREHPFYALSGKTCLAPCPDAFAQILLAFYDRQNVTYILQCADKSLYCGWTNDMAERIKAHNEGRGAKYTRGRGPVRPVYLCAFDTKEEAMKEEARIKGLSREEKYALIR